MIYIIIIYFSYYYAILSVWAYSYVTVIYTWSNDLKAMPSLRFSFACYEMIVESPSLEPIAFVAIQSHQLIPEAPKLCRNRSFEGFLDTQTASETRYVKTKQDYDIFHSLP